MIPTQLLNEVEEFRSEGFEIEVVEIEGFALVILPNYRVPKGYSKDSTQLLFKAPISYPNGKPDMFWTDEDLTLLDKNPPQSAELIEEINGRRWRRFSWHPKSWNPGGDGLRTYLEFVNSRLDKGV